MPNLHPPRLSNLPALLFVLFFGAFPRLAAEEPALLNVKDLAPGIIVEMRYASTDNFTGKTLYAADECLLCEPAAKRLAAVQQKLEQRGLGLKVWDCYRPISVQKRLWDIVPDPRYVADPKTGSRHNRGASVDLTLVDAKGRELAMPTAFDEFSEKAHRSYMNLPAKVRRNRQLLQEAMESEGFIGLATEWWHFDDPSWSKFALRDEPLGSPSLRHDKAADAGRPLLAAEIRQLVVVTSDGWASPTGRLQRWQRTADGWRRVGESWPVSLGKKGMAWGRGKQPAVEGDAAKREGDLTAPAGVFPLGTSYGYAAQAPEGTRWPYEALGDSWVCVDDPDSRTYNRVFNAGPGVERDWRSAETMKRRDHLYRWLINVEQNSPPECGCGSCIFLHIWRRPNSPTEGCTAMHESNLLDLMRWLDPKARPHLVQLPEAEYARRRDGWGLP